MFGDALYRFILWSLVVMWRFFTGAHMDGETHTDATFFKDATVRHKKRQQTNGAWKCMSRWKRMKVRHLCFWPVLAVVIGFACLGWSMFFVIGMLAPGLVLIFWRRIKPHFWLPVVGTHSDGTVHQHWVLRPKYRRKPKGSRRRPGLATAAELEPTTHLVDVPADYEAAVRAELAEELDGQPFVELKLLMVPDDEP